jgi:hypothetical protein
MPLADLLHTNPDAEKVVRTPTLRHTEAALLLSRVHRIDTSPTAVRRWRAANGVAITEQAPEAKQTKKGDPQASIRAEESPDGLTVYHDSWPVQLDGDLRPLVEFFGYNPDHFIVIDDSVKMSKWQTSKGTDSGGRDVLWLYSYKARFQRVSEPLQSAEDAQAVADSIRAFKPRKSPAFHPDRPQVTYVHQQGDEQIGKAEGGGLPGVISRTEDVVQQSYERLKHLLKSNPNIEGILDVANGDTVENIFGHYPSQQRTTDTLRRQFQAGRDLDLMRTEAFAEFGLPMTKAYCTDNHGEMRQSIGMAPFTSESDNLTLILAESVRDVLARSPLADLITWHIPHDQWWTLLTVSGLNVAVGHGHKAKGTLEKWVRDQRDYLHFHHNFKAQLALLGHRHHFHAQDISGTTLLQTPSLDGGSPYFAAMSGNTSRSGVITYLAGPQFNQYFSDLTVI